MCEGCAVVVADRAAEDFLWASFRGRLVGDYRYVEIEDAGGYAEEQGYMVAEVA